MSGAYDDFPLSADIAAEAQSLTPNAYIELFSLDTTQLSNIYGTSTIGTVYYWMPGILGDSPVVFNGISYTPLPIMAQDWQWSGQGPAPRPKIQISDINGFATALVITYGDLVGAVVTRIRTFMDFLDGQAHADVNAIFQPDVFVINQKKEHLPGQYITFELAASFDQQGLKLPRRQILNNACGRTYRIYDTATSSFIAGTCPYAAGTYFTSGGAPTTDPTQDVCGKQLSDCVLRYGQAPLPFYGFPGCGIVPTVG